MKIALFRDTQSGYTSIREVKDSPYAFLSLSDVQVSEVVDVDFPMIQAAVTVCAEVEQLNAIKNLRLKEHKGIVP